MPKSLIGTPPTAHDREVRAKVVEQVRLSRIADQAWQARRSDAEFQEDAERLADAVLAVVRHDQQLPMARLSSQAGLASVRVRLPN